MFLVCGEALYDVFPSGAGDHGQVGLTAVVGGSPLNIAVGLARQDEDVGFLAGLSTDLLGERLATHLLGEGVRLDFLRRKPNPTTLALVGVGTDGAPRYAFYGHDAADVNVTLADLPGDDVALSGVHVGSYTLVRRPIADTIASLVARRRHTLVTLDPNVRPTVEPDMNVWRSRVTALLAHASIVKVSDEDLALLFPDEPVEAVARRWLAAGPALVVVTLGQRGALSFAAAGLRIATQAPRVEVVDAVGAGDTFQATLISGLLRAGVRDRASLARLPAPSLDALLRRCCVAAAITCGRRGADLPTRAEIDAYPS